MENLSETMSDMLRKCKMLEDYISLHLRRETIMPYLRAIKNKADNTTEIVNESNKIIEIEQKEAIQRYKNLMLRMKNQQLTILKLTEIVKGKKKEAMIEIQSVKKPSQINLLTPLAVKLLKRTQNIPMMYYSDYENSPFVPSRIHPMSLQFFDFEAKITLKMFNEIPKYMRGRDTLDELVEFLDNILIPCFIEKYQLINKKRDLIKKATELQLWNIYKEQKLLFPDKKFITQEDLTRKLTKLIDKKIQTKITMLRHISIINEQRKSSTVCYIWMSN